MLATTEVIHADARSAEDAIDAEEETSLMREALQIVLKAHRKEGFDAGYRRAISDVLAASVFVAEKSLLSARDPADGRQVIYRFIQLLERETLLNAKDQEMSDGLGI